jgi:uncharacterized protein YkwD
VKSLVLHWFVPQESNNHKSNLLQPGIISILIAVYLLNQSLLSSLTFLRPGILGYSSEITLEKVLALTNLERSRQGIPELKFSPALSESARLKAQDMFSHNYWAHISPTGTNPWDFFRQANYSYTIAGENLAKDFYDTESMMKAWMKSPTHRANILQSKYREIGVGVANGVLNGVKTTLVVQHFGTPINSKADIPESSSISLIPPPVSASEQSIPALSRSDSASLISPLAISKTIGAIMFILIIGVLVIDGYLTLKRGTKRLSGSAAGHVSFLAIIFLLLLFTRQGAIF